MDVDAEKIPHADMQQVERLDGSNKSLDDPSADNAGAGSNPNTAGDGGVPPGYFTSRIFLGTYLAVACSVMSGVAPFSLAAPLLTSINADIGPSNDIAWVSYVYNLVLACTMCLVGRLSDIFGRRWFFIIGNFLALIGCIVCATANSVPALIGGMAIASVGISTQISFQYVLGELVPLGKRFLVMSTIFPWTVPLGGFAPVISTALQANTALKWRWCFWICVIANTVSTLLYFFFYHPPSFRRLETGKTKLQALREMDWLGMFLFAAGFFIFLLGLNWGGNAYSWKSAPVLVSVIGGAAMLFAFCMWEMYSSVKIPFVPFHLFRNGRWVAMMLCLAVGSMQYYAFAIVWPKMVTGLWPEKVAEGNRLGWSLLLTGFGLQVGQISGAFIANWVNQRYLLMVCTTLATALLAAAACATQYNMWIVLGVMIPGFLAIGVQEAVCGTFCTIALRNQKEIGVGGGVATTTRSGLSVLGSVIYSAILTNRLKKTIPALVPPAAEAAGLPASSVTTLIAYLGGTGKEAAVVGLTPDILTAATTAYRDANARAYQTVMLTTIAFGGISMICAWFTPSIDVEKSHIVSTVLEKEGKTNSKVVTED
ncbi:hypothetical protein SEUCBS139899_003560 [Sporothrix eucalyptigena]|uniref:Major facilitator superfamily (MFS) profile domain-containing protein n=1 Tax=Sporothrix eucalyptigena TaxID=1812306 RepID=A0ABP0B6C1_9PEZI